MADISALTTDTLRSLTIRLNIGIKVIRDWRVDPEA